MPVTAASPDYRIKRPHRSAFVKFIVLLLGRIYLFICLGITRMVVRGAEHIFGAFQRALEGKSRCILAFRHPNGGEAQILMWFILFILRPMARRAKFRFCRAPGVAFIYGYEVVRWGGGIVRWVMPGLGSMPIHHTKMDSAGMARIFSALAEGPYPIAIAPEGQVSYTTESVPRLEQGTVRIGFQAAERLEKKSPDVPVEILPISIHFRYGKMGQWSLKKLLRQIDFYTGLSKANEKAGFSERLERSRMYILRCNEERFGIESSEDASFNERVDAIMDIALERAERILGIERRHNELVDRLYYIRQICWDRIIIPGAESLDHLPPLNRAILDLKAGEAWHASRYMELVDFIWYFRVPVPSEAAPLYVKIEYAQNLWDFANRTMGGAYSNRVTNVHPKRVLIQAAPLINLSERLPEYRENKKKAVASAMEDLKEAYLYCIKQAGEYQI